MPPKRTFGRARSASSVVFARRGTWLVVVESPNKCAAIETYLGAHYQCVATRGHICSLESLKDVDVANGYAATYRVAPAQLTQVAFLRAAAAQFPPGHVLLATDSDREGEAIAFHVARELGLDLATTPRIVFGEITREALLRAVDPAHVRRVDMDMVRAQQARQILDLSVGFKISPLLARHFYFSKTNSLSAGRCQTPALRLVYDNHCAKRAEIDRAEAAYQVTGVFFSPPLKFTLSSDLKDERDARAFFEESENHAHTLAIGARDHATHAPPTPFNTAHLLRAAGSSLRWSPSATMQVAQALYQSGHITYMRTTSRKYAREFLEKARAHISTTFGDARYVGDLAALTPDPAETGAQDPHEAIRVTDLARTEPASTDPRARALYTFIRTHTLESCMSAATAHVYRVSLSAPRALKYLHKLEVPSWLGWRRAALSPAGAADACVVPASALLHMQSIAPNAPIHPVRVDADVVMRGEGAHAPYNEGALVQKLEELGIGRPSTYAGFAEIIQERGYVAKRDLPGVTVECVDLRWTPGLVPESRTTDRVFGAARDRLVLAPVGELCLEFLLKHFAELFDYGYTRDLETQLDRVASRTLAPGEEWWSVCARADADIDRQVALCRSSEKTPSDRDDKEWALDADYSLFFTAYGARVRRRASSEKDAKPTFYPLRAGVEIDITRMRSGGYTVSDLIDVKECSVSEDEKEHDQEPERESGVLRDLGGGRSIRLGKYGHYVFYRTPEMRKPTFTSLKKCPLRFMDCAPEELLKWIEEPRDPPASRRYSSRK